MSYKYIPIDAVQVSLMHWSVEQIIASWENDKSATCAEAGIDVNDNRAYVKTSSITEHEASATKAI